MLKISINKQRSTTRAQSDPCFSQAQMPFSRASETAQDISLLMSLVFHTAPGMPQDVQPSRGAAASPDPAAQLLIPKAQLQS